MKGATKELRDAYRFAGFTPARFVTGHPEDPMGVVVELKRRERGGAVGSAARRDGGTTSAALWCATWIAGAATSTSGSR